MLLGALSQQKEMNPLDYIYHGLNMMIEPLDHKSDEFGLLKEYVYNTWGTRDNDAYRFNPGANRWGNNPDTLRKPEILNIFKIQRKGEAEAISAWKGVPNHFLLFHGSKLYNYMGILSQGLRIAPPEAPPTGYMFGKGIYFADLFEKSYPYCHTGHEKENSTQLMLLCEAALGRQQKLKEAKNVEKLNAGCHSVKGVGRSGPDYSNTVVLANGVKIPFGKTREYYNGERARQMKIGLQHNEYVVYNTSQVRMRYLVQVGLKPTKEKK